MAAPVYSAATERLYARLPDLYRNADENNAYALKRWISGMADQVGEIETLLNRIDYSSEHGTSDLVDPYAADMEWLRWLAAVTGVKLNLNATEGVQREQIGQLTAGLRAGSRASIIAAVKPMLTGTKFVEVHDHTTDTSNFGAAGEWDVAIITSPSESPTSAIVLAAVAAANVKPAGVVIYYRAYNASWATLANARPTWTNWLVTWKVIQDTGLSGGIFASEPASRVSSLGYVGAAYGGEVF